MSLRVGRSVVSRKLFSCPVGTPGGAKRGFIKGWFEWPSFRTEAFRPRDDPRRQDFDPRKSSPSFGANSDAATEDAVQPLFQRKAKDVWESVNAEKTTTAQASSTPPSPPSPTPSSPTPSSSSSSSHPSSSSASFSIGSGSQQNRKYSTYVVRSCAVPQQTDVPGNESQVQNQTGQQHDEENSSKELYHCDQSLTIRAMGAMGGFNVLFWGQYLASIFLFDQKNITVQGVEISLAGDPMWGYAGVVGTGMILYSTYMFATHAVNRAYLTSDKKRIGFQIHDMWGNPGRILEVKLGLAKKVTIPGIISKNSSYIPVKIEGRDKNVILDESGRFEYDGELLRLLDESQESMIQSKEERRKLGREGGGSGTYHRYNQRNNRKRR